MAVVPFFSERESDSSPTNLEREIFARSTFSDVEGEKERGEPLKGSFSSAALSLYLAVALALARACVVLSKTLAFR